MSEYNIIADVAGQYKALKALLAKMPASATALLVGDIVDRGPSSRKVVQFVRENNLLVLKGNHEDMLVDFALGRNVYSPDIWFINGGAQTARSYLPNLKTKEYSTKQLQDALHDDAVWMSELPTFFRTPGLLVTHAPFQSEVSDTHIEFLWNRSKPIQQPGYFMVHGHNSRKNVLWYRPEPWPFESEAPPYGVNIDTSQAEILTGIHWPSLEIFQQEYR